MTQSSFQTIINTLLDESKDFPKKYFSLFSDIDTASLQALMEIWSRISLNRKLALLNGLLTLAEGDTITSFDDIAHTLINDPEPEVRIQAIQLLQFVEDLRTARALIKILLNDPDQLVRAEAARELGKFILYGELDKIPGDITNLITDALLKAANDDHNKADLRRHSLASLGYSGRPEVETLIESSFRREDPQWKASALLAMGRSSNPERWADIVISMLLDEEPEIREEAARAAGELNLQDARQILINMLTEEEEDDDVIHAAIWALSIIGGEDVRTYFESLAANTDDEEMLDFIDEALENLTFNEELESLDLLSFDSLDELGGLIELEEDDEESKPKKKKK